MTPQEKLRDVLRDIFTHEDILILGQYDAERVDVNRIYIAGHSQASAYEHMNVVEGKTIIISTNISR